MSRRWLTGLLGLVLLAGCGGTSGSRDADEVDKRMERAADRLAAVDDIRMVGSMNSTARNNRFALRGAFVMTSDAQRMSMDGTMTQGGRDIRLKMINVGDDFYYRGQDFQSLLKPGQRWVHATIGGPTLGFAQFFDLLGSTREMRFVGKETVRGRATDHFDGTVSVDAIAEAFGAKAPEEFADGTDPDDLRMELGVWLDAEDNLRRLKIDASVTGTQQRIEGSFDVLEYDTGRPIAAPPAAQVAELEG